MNTINTYLCPVCGGSSLQAEVILPVVQNIEGDWLVQSVDQNDVNFAVDNVNTDVTCTNTMCGDPYLLDETLDMGELLGIEELKGNFFNLTNLKENESVEQYLCTILGKPFDHDGLASFNEIERACLKTLQDNIDYNPWSGKLEFCEILSN